MTTIAFDGIELAGDTQMSDGNVKARVLKLHRLKNGLIVGGAGDAVAIGMFIDWLDTPGDWEVPEFRGKRTDDEDSGDFSAMVIMPDGEIVYYDHRCFPLSIAEPKYAIGSGRDFAIGVMDAGGSAVAAVRSAIKRDTGTGGNIQVLSLDGKTDRMVTA